MMPLALLGYLGLVGELECLLQVADGELLGCGVYVLGYLAGEQQQTADGVPQAHQHAIDGCSPPCGAQWMLSGGNLRHNLAKE